MEIENKRNPNIEEKDKLLYLSLNLYSTFYPKYYLLETELKGRIFQLLREKLGDDWFSLQINSINGNNLFKQETEIILRRKPTGFVLSDKGLFVESGFGMWVEFFNRNLYKEAKGLPILVFHRLPPTIKRKDLYEKLTIVKELRNQLFHYRLLPITEPKQLKYLDELIEINSTLMDLLIWLDAPVSGLSLNEFESKAAEIRALLI